MVDTNNHNFDKNFHKRNASMNSNIGQRETVAAAALIEYASLTNFQ